MPYILHHTFSGPLGPLTLNYIIIIYIKETNSWEPSQVKETKKTKKTTLRLESLETPYQANPPGVGMLPETSRATGEQCFQQIEGRSLDK